MLSMMSLHIENSNRSISMITESLSLIQLQQQNLSQMIQIINNDREEEVPVTFTFNDYTLGNSNITTDTSSNSTMNPIITNLLNLIETHGTSSNTTTVESIIIENVTTCISFNEIQNPSNLVCPISLEPFQSNDLILKINRCGHYFKDRSLRQWFLRSHRCPVCRQDIRINNNLL